MAEFEREKCFSDIARGGALPQVYSRILKKMGPHRPSSVVVWPQFDTETKKADLTVVVRSALRCLSPVIADCWEVYLSFNPVGMVSPRAELVSPEAIAIASCNGLI